MNQKTTSRTTAVAVAAAAVLFADAGSSGAEAQAQKCATMRKINIGVAVSPPNVVHTAPYTAKALGFFEKLCIDASIIQFEGGQSAAAAAAAAQGSAIISVSDVAVGRGAKVQQIWGLAPYLPHVYMTGPDIKTPADLKGKRLSATGGGVGGFNWRMGRDVLKRAGLKVEEANFISSATAGRLPGLIAGQVDGVALHPEDEYLAKKQKPTLNALVRLGEVLPNYLFNAYGASLAWIARDRALLRDTVAAMIQANRAQYEGTEKAKVLKAVMEATQKPQDAVEFAIKTLTANCIWSVNSGFDKKRMEWHTQYSVDAGDVEAAKRPKPEQVSNYELAEEAVKVAGGRKSIGKCSL
jgi:ABC-type nitrate/sulfonate/bicarbonate transport system substrate-binding protein